MREIAVAAVFLCACAEQSHAPEKQLDVPVQKP